MSIQKLHESVRELVIIEPSADSAEVVHESQLVALRASKAALVAQGRAIKVADPESFALAGEWIDGCDAFIDAVEARFDEPISQANRRHKALTGMRKEITTGIPELAAYFRGARAGYKAAVDAAEKKAREEAERKAREEAEARQREAARLAREEAERVAAAAAEAKRLADEEAARVAAAAAEAKRIADAEAARLAAEAAKIEDADAAMEAAAAAEEAAAEALRQEAEAAERARVAAEAAAAAEAEAAERARQAAAEAEAAAAMPVVVARVHVEPVLEKEDGVTWADNWVAEYDEVEALRACVDAGALEYLTLNTKAINAAAKSQKSLARIPGVRVVNNKMERRK